MLGLIKPCSLSLFQNLEINGGGLSSRTTGIGPGCLYVLIRCHCRRIELLETRIAELSKAQLGGDDDLSIEPSPPSDVEILERTTTQVFSPSVYQTLDCFPGFENSQVSSSQTLPPVLSSADGGWKGEQTTSAKTERLVGGIRVTPIPSTDHEVSANP